MQRRQFNQFVASFAALGASVGGMRASAAASSVHYTLAGASPGGLWTLLGAGLDNAVSAGMPGSSITYQTSGGGFANASLVQTGKTELGLIHDAELSIALRGDAPFKAPMDKLRKIGYLYDWAPMQFIANKSFADKYNVESLGDFAKSEVPAKITVNRAGNITGRIATAMLDTAGATDKAVKSWGGTIIAAGSSEQSTLFQNGRVNVFTNGVFVGHSSIREIENTVDIKLLSVPDEVMDVVGEKFGIGRFTIPAGSYKNQDSDVETLTLGAVLIVSDEMSEEEGYNLTAAIIDNINKIRDVHPSMKALTPELLVKETPSPFHPGAIKAYKEAGLLK